MKVLVDKDEYAKGTLKRLEVLERHVKEYLLSKYGKRI
jgi:tetrahydromethanopterin S-methyltransferase subunit G